jgi:hypothetical protein
VALSEAEAEATQVVCWTQAVSFLVKEAAELTEFSRSLCSSLHGCDAVTVQHAALLMASAQTLGRTLQAALQAQAKADAYQIDVSALLSMRSACAQLKKDWAQASVALASPIDSAEIESLDVRTCTVRSGERLTHCGFFVLQDLSLRLGELEAEFGRSKDAIAAQNVTLQSLLAFLQRHGLSSSELLEQCALHVTRIDRKRSAAQSVRVLQLLRQTLCVAATADSKAHSPPSSRLAPGGAQHEAPTERSNPFQPMAVWSGSHEELRQLLAENSASLGGMLEVNPLIALPLNSVRQGTAIDLLSHCIHLF